MCHSQLRVQGNGIPTHARARHLPHADGFHLPAPHRLRARQVDRSSIILSWHETDSRLHSLTRRKLLLCTVCAFVSPLNATVFLLVSIGLLQVLPGVGSSEGSSLVDIAAQFVSGLRCYLFLDQQCRDNHTFFLLTGYCVLNFLFNITGVRCD